jgi:DNA adenine methylase
VLLLVVCAGPGVRGEVCRMKPPMPYYGAKQTLAERIVSFFPPHKHYVEPFCGSLAVLLAKEPSRMETVNDLDGSLMTFWRVLLDRPLDLERVCAFTPHSRAEYEACRDGEPVEDEIEVARRVWVRLTQGRGGQLRRTTGWRHFKDPHGSSTSMPGYLEAYRQRFAPAAARLIGVSLEARPALELIRTYGGHKDALLYVDPPYLGSTRQWGNQYRHEMRSEDEHRELAEALRTVAAAVVLSGYPSPLYDLELYADWDRLELPTQNSQGGARSARTEVLWSNRSLATADHLFTVEGIA